MPIRSSSSAVYDLSTLNGSDRVIAGKESCASHGKFGRAELASGDCRAMMEVTPLVSQGLAGEPAQSPLSTPLQLCLLHQELRGQVPLRFVSLEQPTAPLCHLIRAWPGPLW